MTENQGRIKVTHIITSLLMGGAEKVLLRLVQQMDHERFDNEVIALTTVGTGLLSEEFIASGVPVKVIGFNKGSANIAAVFRLCSALRKSKPDIVQTWLYHGDLLGGVGAKLCTRAPVLWNLRQSNLHDERSTKSTVAIAKLCSKLSSVVPSKIVCGSKAARKVHADMGYNANKMVLVENGFDTATHQHDEALGKAFRDNLEVDDATVLVGHAARFDPQKDHKTFLRAAAQLVLKDKNVKFVLCGTDVSWDNPELTDEIEALGLKDNVHLIGIVDDMTAFYSAVDLVVMSSAFGEGAPNVLGEAMSCSTPCVATDVGDSAHILGDTGPIVAVGDVNGMAEAMLSMVEGLRNSQNRYGAAARQRIVEHFPVEKMVRDYEDLYQQVNKLRN